MADADRKHHGYTTTESERPAVPEPSHAERARTLMAQGREATLATRSRRHPGFPFASLMPYALDAAGRPLVLVSALAIHTQNLQQDDRCSLLVTESDQEGGRDPLGLARVTLVGRLQAPTADAEDLAGIRALYLDRHAGARYWVDYPDFHFYRMEVEEVYYVGGFGVMGWVSGDDFRQAAPDPLHEHARSIIDHMNGDHADALVLIARAEGLQAVEEAKMTAVDRLGFHLQVRRKEELQGFRIGFSAEARDPGRVRELLVAQVKEAKEKLSSP